MISLLSVITKVFVTAHFNQSYVFRRETFDFTPTWYGFRPESSTEFANLDIVHSCYENINGKLFTGLIMIVVKKLLLRLSNLSCCKN